MLSPQTTKVASDSYDIQMRERVLFAGVALTLLFVVVNVTYVLLTWSDPNRTLILLMASVGLADVVASLLVSNRRLAQSKHCERYMTLWYMGTVAYVSIACAADGGVTSPIFAAYFVLVVFKALVLPTVQVIRIGLFTIAAATAVAIVCGNPPVISASLIAGLAATATISAWTARQHMLHRTALYETQIETIRLLVRAVSFRDLETGDHVERIASYVSLICRSLGCSDRFTDLMRQASPMHDVGKIGIPDRVLLKPGRLDDAERQQVERHAELGYDLLAGSGNEMLEIAATIAITHHERYDGAGYPNRLSGEAIPIEGRIVAVADVFDALTSDRVYRPAMTFDEAIRVITDGSGSHFDPTIVDAFMAELDAVAAIQSRNTEVVPIVDPSAELVAPHSVPAVA